MGMKKEVNFSELPPIKKDLYVEHVDVKALTDEQVTAFRREHAMHIIGRDVPKPISRFEQVDFGKTTMSKLAGQGFDTPTPIQAQGWPMALSGRNMVGIAQTGSGKTLSYILPAISHILAASRLSSTDPLALVLAPTRELACQIQEVARTYGNAVRIRNACVYGGVPKGDQIRALRNGTEIVIATPGRLLDFLDAGLVSISAISYLVLDEADRMLDMGFEPQIRRLLEHIRPDRQVLMWSATWPKGVQRLAHDMLGRDFIQVNIGTDTALTANKRIRQHIMLTREEDKEVRLAELLAAIYEGGPEAGMPNSNKCEKANTDGVMCRTIIFSNKKRICDELAHKAYQDGWAVDAIHGDRLQPERDATLARFRSGEVPVLIATDVAARGLDVRDVQVIINYDMPLDIEDYVHRIGRTARGSDEKVGCAYAFFDPFGNKRLARDLVGLLQRSEQPVPPELQALAPQRSLPNRYSRYNHDGGYSHGSSRGRGGGYSRGGSNNSYSSNGRGGSRGGQSRFASY